MGGVGASPDPADPEKTFRVLTLYAVDDLFARSISRMSPSSMI